MIYKIELPKDKELKKVTHHNKLVDLIYVGDVFKTNDGEYTIVDINSEDNTLFKTVYQGKHKRLLNRDLRWSQAFIENILFYNGYNQGRGN